MKEPSDYDHQDYLSLMCCHEFDCGVKVFRSELVDGNKLITVAYEPPIEEVESPGDIETIDRFLMADGMNIEKLTVEIAVSIAEAVLEYSE